MADATIPTVSVPVVGDIEAIPDLEERVRVAAAVAAAGKAAVPVRDDAMIALLKDGAKPADVGKLAGIGSSQMVRYSRRARGEG